MTVRVLSVLAALLALSCAPPEQPLTSGERQALERVRVDIVGNWSCDEGSEHALLRNFAQDGSGTVERLNQEYGREGKGREVLLDLAIRVTWRVEQDRVYPVLITEAGNTDVLVLELDVGGRKLARSREAVEIIKKSLADSFAEEVYRTKIFRLDETHLSILSGKRRSYCLRSAAS